MHRTRIAFRCLGGRHTFQVNTIFKLEDGRITQIHRRYQESNTHVELPEVL